MFNQALMSVVFLPSKGGEHMTRFEISKQSLIKKYENIDIYMKKWNVSEAYVRTHSDPAHLS